jgi:hypothetical protein
MASLSNIIQRCIAAVEVPGRAIKVHHAVEHGLGLILADTELNVMAVREWLTDKISRALSGKRRKLAVAPPEYVRVWSAAANGGVGAAVVIPRQGDLFIDPFQLDEAYKLEGGNVEMKRTRYLTQRDFRGVIGIREKQHIADTKHLGRLRNTYTRLQPYWDIDPEMTYEEACALYVRHNGMPPDDDEEDG